MATTRRTSGASHGTAALGLLLVLVLAGCGGPPSAPGSEGRSGCVERRGARRDATPYENPRPLASGSTAGADASRSVSETGDEALAVTEDIGTATHLSLGPHARSRVPVPGGSAQSGGRCDGCAFVRSWSPPLL